MSGINVLGLGVADKAHFDLPATKAFEHSELIIGSERQLNVIEHLLKDNQQTTVLPPLADLKALLDDASDKEVTVLASGDPLYFGIGSWLSRHFERSRLAFYPAVSSIQAACHALGFAQQDVEVISLHGRALSGLRRKLKNQQTLVILTDKHSHPQALAKQCVEAGLAESTLWVCERLGYPEQKISRFKVTDSIDESFDPLHVSVLKTGGAGGILPEFPGFADALFITDKAPGQGMISKREVRLSILSLLQVARGDVIWDVGAGCGSVSVELQFWQHQAKVFAIEHHPARLSCLQQNCNRFGVTPTIVEGRAPECFTELPVANKVFVGGSDGNMADILNQCWQQLPTGGLLVASCVTENSKMQLLQFAQTLSTEQTETLQVAVSKGTTLAGQLMYKPNLPVNLFKFTKG